MTHAMTVPLTMQAVGNLSQLVRAASEAPYLSADEERALAVRLQEQNDLEAARQLVSSHLRYVIHIARGYAGYGLPMADLIQEGAIGLMKAVRRFDPRRGVRLVSFAVHWVRAEIHEYVLRNWHIVKIATTKAQRKLFFNLRQHKQRLGHLGDAEAREIARDLDVRPQDVLDMDARLSDRAVSFDGAPDSGDESPSPSLVVPDQRPDPSQALEDAQWADHQLKLLRRGLDTLDARSRDIVEQRWLAEHKTGLKELGEKYGVSAERIRQLENQALKRLSSQLQAAA
ncbi:RNA polymerase sigma factor RpoH [Immundisolibacter sp.]|uniref:RNA polymerase sigma factor RpoH n=1 Tax=Immundisolibacter sp. TaxID=1934948 RepID=UPI000EC0CAAA|nr:RNA polymerase sigma factor RpoH [Gammaproteobacteria bacterium]